MKLQNKPETLIWIDRCGDTLISGTFRPETKSPDFDPNIKINKTQMCAMNVLLAYGNFDVNAGLYSLYSDLCVKKCRVEDYIKPLFRDMQVYDGRQARDMLEKRNVDISDFHFVSPSRGAILRGHAPFIPDGQTIEILARQNDFSVAC